MCLAIVDKHAPLKEKCVKIANQPEWITEEILQNMAECDHYKDIGDEDNYRRTRNRVTNMIELSKTEDKPRQQQKALELLKGISPKMC